MNYERISGDAPPQPLKSSVDENDYEPLDALGWAGVICMVAFVFGLLWMIAVAVSGVFYWFRELFSLFH